MYTCVVEAQQREKGQIWHRHNAYSFIFTAHSDVYCHLMYTVMYCLTGWREALLELCLRTQHNVKGSSRRRAHWPRGHWASAYSPVGLFKAVFVGEIFRYISLSVLTFFLASKDLKLSFTANIVYHEVP